MSSTVRRHECNRHHLGTSGTHFYFSEATHALLGMVEEPGASVQGAQRMIAGIIGV